MAISIEKLPDIPVLVIRLPAGEEIANMPEEDLTHVKSILDGLSEPVYLIRDTTGSQIKISFELITTIANKLTRQYQLMKHPNIIENIFVTQSRPLELALAGLRSPVFGSNKVQTMATYEEAIAYVREKLA
jgi:hypothetical protein